MKRLKSTWATCFSFSCSMVTALGKAAQVEVRACTKCDLLASLARWAEFQEHMNRVDTPLQLCRYLRCAFGLKAVISRHSPNQTNIHKPLNPSFCVELGALHCKVHVLPGMWFGVYIWGQNIIGHPKSLV